MLGKQGKRAYIRTLKRKGRKIDAKYYASCYGKIRYQNYEEARQANAAKASKVRPYPCKYCKYYHVGRRPHE